LLWLDSYFSGEKKWSMGLAEERGTLSAREPLPVLSVEDVRVTYTVHEETQRRSFKALVSSGFRRPRPRLVKAVRGVSFQLNEGEALGLIGTNGSGKTSLLRAVAGLVPLSTGRVRARSEPVMLGVGAAMNPELSGRRNVYLGGTALGLSRRQIDQRFNEIVGFAGVGEFIDMPLRAYSAGMNSRLRFSIAAAVEPDILLIDEALAVGDAEFKRRSEQRMRELVEKAGALVLVSHSLSSIEALCTRVIWLHRGELRMDAPTKDVVKAYLEHAGG
jgi:teichoic acid transport system ATP-binding protein